MAANLSTLITLGLLAAAAAEPPSASRVILRWRPIDGAATYEVQIAADPAFTRIVAEGKTAETTFVWGEYPATPHHWRVRAVSAEGRTSVWSPARVISAELAAPRPMSPKAGANLPAEGNETAVSFAWEACELCVSYLFELDRDARFARPLVAQPLADRTLRLRLRGLGRFYWRVTGVDPGGNRTPPAKAHELRLALPAPEPQAPPAVHRAPWREPEVVELGWSAHPLASRWRVEITAGDEPRPPLEVTEPRLPFAAPPGEYAWQVVAVAPGGQTSAPSPPRRLTVTLAVPEGLTPADGAQLEADDDEPLVVRWTAVPAAVAYAVEVAGEPSFATPLVSVRTAEPTATLSGLPPGPLHWRVSAEGTSPALTSTSAAVSLTLRQRAPPPTVEPPPLPPVAIAPAAPLGLSLAGRVAWQTSFAALSAPALGAELGWRLPPWPTLALALRLGWTRDAARIPPPGERLRPITSTAHLVPLTLLGLYTRPLAVVELYGGAGVGAELALVTLGRQRQLSAAPRAVVTAGAGLPLGPGSAFAELDLAYSNLDNRRARLRTAGLTLGLGYRWMP